MQFELPYREIRLKINRGVRSNNGFQKKYMIGNNHEIEFYSGANWTKTDLILRSYPIYNALNNYEICPSEMFIKKQEYLLETIDYCITYIFGSSLLLDISQNAIPYSHTNNFNEIYNVIRESMGKEKQYQVSTICSMPMEVVGYMKAETIDRLINFIYLAKDNIIKREVLEFYRYGQLLIDEPFLHWFKAWEILKKVIGNKVNDILTKKEIKYLGLYPQIIRHTKFHNLYKKTLIELMNEYPLELQSKKEAIDTYRKYLKNAINEYFLNN